MANGERGLDQLSGENGKPAGVGGISTDVTQFMRGQEALQRSQFYLTEGQRLTHTGSWAFNPAGFFDYWSEELFQIYGLDRKKGPPTLEEYLAAIHPQDREFMAETIRRMHAENCGCDVKKRIIRPGGQVRFIRCVGIPVLGNGVLKGFLGTAMDVTEQEQMTQELRRREAYLAEAQKLSQTGSFGWKPGSDEMVWSDETHRIFGLDLATKPTIEDVLSRAHPEDRASIQLVIDRAAREARDWDLEHRLLMDDGSLKHLRVVARAVRDELDDDIEYVGAVMDVTAAKQSLQALERAYAEIGRLKDELEKENIVLREEIDRSSMFEEIVGESPAVQALLLRVAKVAPTDSTVLISGETGTGKELIARAIHKRSRRAGHAFVSVNCAAIPPSLIASELFGHEKGAFTGAIQRRLGRFELAEGGTIFLDEIGELPAETQISLLRVLQEREFERVGGSKIIRADVRVIAATNRDLRAAIDAGTFRSDLYYRFNVFPIEVPPLRKRKQDIPLLVGYFIDRYSSKTGKKIRTIDSPTLERLTAYAWPGNVRELQNVIERSIIVCETEKFTVDESWLAPTTALTDQSIRTFFKLSPSEEKKAIEAALTEARGRISGPSGAAAKLGLPPSTLDSKIKALKINKYQYKAVS